LPVRGCAWRTGRGGHQVKRRNANARKGRTPILNGIIWV
jgi:hypothetical protein